MHQLPIFDDPAPPTPPPSAPANLRDYEYYVVFFSGGKDSIACVLHLLESGAPHDRIELWHHEIDGRDGSHLMDWPCTPAYCRAFAQAFNLPLYASWKVGGFEREMLRDNAPTAPTRFETPDGTVHEAGGQSAKRGTRLRFPQVSADRINPPQAARCQAARSGGFLAGLSQTRMQSVLIYIIL